MNNGRGNIGLIIGIIVVVLIIAIVGVIFLVNGNKDSKDGTVQNIANTSSNKLNNENEENNSNQIDLSNWGVPDSIVVEIGDTITRACIKFPTLSGIIRGTGKIAYQTDKTLVILDGQLTSISPNVNEIRFCI